MTREEIASEAKKLYDSVDNINSVSEARQAARTISKLVFYLSRLKDETETDTGVVINVDGAT